MDLRVFGSHACTGLGSVLVLLIGALAGGCNPTAEDTPAADDSPPAETAETEPEAPPAWIVQAVAQPRGLISHEAGASDDYILFSQLTDGVVYLIDREGHAVHTWQTDKVSMSNYLLDDGSLLRGARLAEPPNFKAGGVGGYLQRLDWDGNVLWEWQMGDEQRILHHDLEPLPNGNVLSIAWEQKSPQEAAAMGRRPELTPQKGVWADWIVEIEPVPPSGARIVWEWHVWDHLVQNHNAEAANHGNPQDHPRRLDINADGATQGAIDEEELKQLQALGYVPDDATTEDVQADFLHMNAIDYNAELDQIAVSLPEIGEIWILDHSTTTDEAKGSTGGRWGHGGDFLYRWGNPAAYGRGSAEDQQLFYQHQVLWIPEGMEGAGHLTMFNNGGERGYSSVMEIAPPGEGSGEYPLAEGEAWGPAAAAWTYTAPERETFHSPFISGAVRLANGNTLVCSGPQGRFFEVTAAGDMVWEYRNPYHGNVPGWNPPGVDGLYYATFRANPVAVDHPGLEGRSLEPLDPQPEFFVPPPPSETGAGGEGDEESE